MAITQITSEAEAKRILLDALNNLDAVSVFATTHKLHIDQFYDTDTRKRLQALRLPKPPTPIHPLLATSTDKHKKLWSEYCYKIESSEHSFDDVLTSLEAYCKQKNAGNQMGKGEIIDSIIRSGDPESLKAVGKVLWVIGSLALSHIRNADARAVATQRGHKGVTQGDKTAAANGMWEVLRSYNPMADRTMLNGRIGAGIRWDTFLSGKEVGTIVAVHVLPPSLMSRFVKLAFIVDEIPWVSQKAKKATPCVETLLNSLVQLTDSRKRKAPAGNLPATGRKSKRAIAAGIVVPVSPSSNRRDQVSPNTDRGTSEIGANRSQPSIPDPNSHPIPAEKLASAVIAEPDSAELETPGASPSSMRTLVDAAEYISAQDAAPVAGQQDPASEGIFIAGGMNPLTSEERDNMTLDPRSLSQPGLRSSGGCFLFSGRLGFRPGGENPMISGAQEHRLRSGGGVRLFES